MPRAKAAAPAVADIPSFTLRLPELTTRDVWVGIYSYMWGTVVMLFDEEPARDPVFGTYPLIGNYASESASYQSVDIDQWVTWFGSVQPFVDAGLIEYRKRIACYAAVSGRSVRGQSRSIDCHRVIPIRLTACWDEHGQLIGLNTDVDQ